MSWKTVIDQLWPDATFFPPADPALIAQAEQLLGSRFPAELVALFRETDGVTAHYATHYVFRLAPTAEPYDSLVQQNSEMRTTPIFAELYAPFTDLLLIGADGGGSLFGYQIQDGQVTSTIIYWNHETDERTSISTTGLAGYFTFAAQMYQDDE